MNLSTTYMGLHLPHPLVVGASPLSDDLDLVRQLEDPAQQLLSCVHCMKKRLPASRCRISFSPKSTAIHFRRLRVTPRN